MSNDEDSKKDFTRIEDMNEFIHEDDTIEASEEFSPPELPSDDESEGNHFEEFSFDSPDSNNSSEFDFEGSEEIEELPGDIPKLAEPDEESFQESFEDETGEFPLQENFSDGKEDLQEEEEEEEELNLAETLEPEEIIEPEKNIPEPSLAVHKQTEAEEFVAEIKEFTEKISYGKASLGQGPPFAIKIQNIKSSQIDKIYSIFKEHEVIDKAEKEKIKNSLSNGSYLLSQLNEYSALVIFHKLIKLELTLDFGPVGDIHQPESYDPNENKGPIDNSFGHQNKIDYQDNISESEKVILSTLETIAGKTITQHLGIVHGSTTVTYKELTELGQSKKSINDHQTNELESLKSQAQELKGNAIIGLKWVVTPLQNNDSPEDLFHIYLSGDCVSIQDDEL